MRIIEIKEELYVQSILSELSKLHAELSNCAQNLERGIVRVNGIQGAQAYQTGANSSVALFDANEDFFYIKTTDGAGEVGKKYGLPAPEFYAELAKSFLFDKNAKSHESKIAAYYNYIVK